MDSLNISPSNICRMNKTNMPPRYTLGQFQDSTYKWKILSVSRWDQTGHLQRYNIRLLRKIMSTIFFYCYLHEKVFLSLEKLQQCHIAGLLKKLLSSKMKRMLPYSNNTTTNAYGILTSVYSCTSISTCNTYLCHWHFCFALYVDRKTFSAYKTLVINIHLPNHLSFLPTLSKLYLYIKHFVWDTKIKLDIPALIS